MRSWLLRLGKLIVLRGREGVVMVATGERHRMEACASVQRIRPCLGGRPMVLVTDKITPPMVDLFDRVLIHPDAQGSYRDKIAPLRLLPFKRNLFLDTDVALLQPVDDIFALLKSVDVVGCHAPVRWSQWRDMNVPEGFVEINTGVIGLRRSRPVRKLIREWLKTYDQAGVAFDQASFRSALWKSCRRGLRIWVLPPEYNLRTTKPWIAGKGLAVKVLHGRIPDSMRETLVEYLNANTSSFRSSCVFPTGQNAHPLPRLPKPVARSRPLLTHEFAPNSCRRLFVLGAGRSGTSLLAGLFRNSGLFMGDSAYQARGANPHGFYEDREVNAINEALLAPLLQSAQPQLGDGQRWLASLPLDVSLDAASYLQLRISSLYSRGPFCFKDPRFCHTLPLWRQLLPDADCSQTAFLCVFRHPAAALISTFHELHAAPYLRSLAISADQVLQSWISHYCHVLHHHSKTGRWLFVHYEQLLEPDGLDRIQAFTGHQVDRLLPEQALNRSKPPALELPGDATLIYQELCTLASFPFNL